MNLLWLAAFGSPVAARLGAARTLVLAAVTSLGGAAAHWLAYHGEVVPMIGASAVVSGFMGAATRFAFTGTRIRGKLNVHGPALSLWASLSNPNIAIFLIVWFGLNYLLAAAWFRSPVQIWQLPGRPMSAAFWPDFCFFRL
ncbi:MAG: rhomboid family intramembrane serine protease [Nitratireductor sp.]